MRSSRSLCASSAVLITLLLANLVAITPTQGQVAAQNRLLKSDAIVPLKTHSLYSPYVEADLQNPFWDYGGDAIVDTNRAVLLTQDRRSQDGWLWSRLPLSVPNFEIITEFKVDGKSYGSHPYGDGFAFWLTEERAQSGPVLGSKDYFTGLGIMFDTFANARHVSFSPVSISTSHHTSLTLHFTSRTPSLASWQSVSMASRAIESTRTAPIKKWQAAPSTFVEQRWRPSSDSPMSRTYSQS